MKLLHNIYLAFFVLLLSGILFCYSLFQYNLAKVSNDDTPKIVVIKPGSIDSIANTLYEEHLIKNKLAFKLYTKFSGKTNLKAATYSLKENMGVQKIVEILYKGNGSNTEQISITFKEGLNMRSVAKKIAEETSNTEEAVYDTLQNEDYLRSLIQQYWFLTESILNHDIYYSLEGYLYPNTYYFSSKDVTVEEIFETMLQEMEKQLENYHEKMEHNYLSFHEIITLASIVELEGVSLEDRKGIAGVFLNRLETGMNLGSDVTTYYGAKIDMGERDLYASEIKECNSYNTRCANFVGIPVSPICNPSIDAIIAVLEPTTSNYYYFVADKNKKVYFSKNITEHNNIIAKLKREDLWYEY